MTPLGFLACRLGCCAPVGHAQQRSHLSVRSVQNNAPRKPWLSALCTRSGESCHGSAVTEGIKTGGFIPLSTCDYPFHRSRLSARLLCAGGTRPATTELTNENGSERLLCPSGARSAMSEATAEFSTGDLPPTGTRSPLGGPRRLRSSLFPLYK